MGPHRLCEFITSSPTPFQAVSNLSHRLASSSFTRLSERSLDPSHLKPGKSYFYTRNQSSIVAFTLPSAKPTPQTSISFAVGHLDSPCLKLRPVSKRVKDGFIQVGVETYGGGIWPTWFDRDLSLAGRVIVASPSSTSDGAGKNEDEKGFVSKLVNIHRPLMRIPNLAIHLERTMTDNLKFNKETELRPILGMVEEQLNSPTSKENEKKESDVAGKEDGLERDVAGMSGKHHPLLLQMLADELGCNVADIQDFELCVYLFDSASSTLSLHLTTLQLSLPAILAADGDPPKGACTIPNLHVSAAFPTNSSSPRG